jgi:hypothetical protein
MKKIGFFVLLVITCIVISPTLTGCKPKTYPASDSITMFLDTTIMQKLTQHQLEVVMDNDSLFGDFYKIIRTKTDSVDDVQRVKWKKITYSSAYKYYKLSKDSTYWRGANKKWNKERLEVFAEPISAMNVFNKANIRANYTGGQYGYTNEITFDVISDVACEANIHIFFHPTALKRGFNDDTWYSLVKGTNSYSWSTTYENAKWFVLFANAQGGGTLDYKVNQIKYKGKIYEVNTALNTYVPTEADYDFGKQMDSLRTLNSELYHLLVEPNSEDE